MSSAASARTVISIPIALLGEAEDEMYAEAPGGAVALETLLEVPRLLRAMKPPADAKLSEVPERGEGALLSDP